MIRIFVQAYDENGEPFVAEHYQFGAVPRVGEQVVVDNDAEPLLLKVIAVTHLSEPTGDVASPISYVQLNCEVIR